MTKIAYSLAGAARAASVEKHDIIDAIKNDQLVARCVKDDKVVVLNSDIQTWLESKPNYRSS